MPNAYRDVAEDVAFIALDDEGATFEDEGTMPLWVLVTVTSVAWGVFILATCIMAAQMANR